MYETIKELHIEIDQRIQQITSNRFNNIPPQFYDMMLNRTAIKYIQSKSNRKTNYKAEGLEDSKKRVEDFQSLKRETEWLPVINDDGKTGRGFVLLPSNYLKFISSTSALEYGKGITSKKTNDSLDCLVTTGDNFKNVYYQVFTLDDFYNNQYIWLINDKYTIDEFFTYEDFNLLELIEDGYSLNVEFPKYFIERLYDALNTYTIQVEIEPNVFKNNHLGKYEVYYEHYKDRYYPHCFIITSTDIFNLQFGNPGYDETPEYWSNVEQNVYTNNCFTCTPNTYSENDLIASESIRETLNDFYGNKNRHKNPITELINDKLYVYQGKDFCVSEIKITYLKKPRLFSSDLDQMSDMLVTPEFVDMVVSDILLILKDNTFNLVKQQTNIE